MKYLLIIFLLFASCKVKKPIVITNTIRDTIHITKIQKIRVPVKSTITIEKPCDSLNILRDFKRTFKSEKVFVQVSSNEGRIEVEINIDSLKTEWIKTYEGKTNIIVKEIPVDKPVPFIPKWVWWISGGFILSLVWNFKKFIPFLPF